MRGGDGGEAANGGRHPAGTAVPDQVPGPARAGACRLPGRRLRDSDGGGGADGVGLAALVAPQRDAEADQRDAGGHRERAAEGQRQRGQRERGDGAVGEQRGSPAGQHAGAEQRDPEQQTADE